MWRIFAAVSPEALPVAAVCLGVLALVSLVVGGMLLFFGVQQLIHALASRGWPTTRGAIVASAGNAGKKRRLPIGSRPDEAGVVYAYVVGGVEYRSARVRFGPDYCIERGDFGRAIRRCPKGTEVTVHYNPRNPSIAVLEAGTHWWHYTTALAGPVLLFLGFAMAIGAYEAATGLGQR